MKVSERVTAILDRCERLVPPLLLLSGLIVALCVVSPALADTQKTRPKQIGETGRTNRDPRPAAPNVCVQHTLTADPATGDIKLTAQFINKDGNEKKFVFCQMVGINTAEEEVQGMCDLFFDRAANKIKCMKSTRTFPSFTDSFHFGCKKVVLAGNETKPVDYGSGQHDKFKGKKAADFFVTYADYVQLPAGADFDEDSCKGCFGKDTSTGLGPPEPLGIMGDWFLPQLPFDDPYIVYQPIGGAPFTPEYRSIHLPLGTPSNFPVDVPQLPRNVPEPVPDSYSVPESV